jgi:iron complex transport system substrate-binding protein
MHPVQRRVKIGCLLVTVIFLCAGCQKIDYVPPPIVEFRVLKDDLDREVRLPLKVDRAVSLAPNITEMVFAVGAGDRLVGVTTYCNYPERAKAIPKIGDTLNPNLETVVALKPDVVLVSGASQLESFTKILEQNGIAVYVTNPTSLREVFNNLRNLAAVFGTLPEAAGTIGELELRTDRLYGKIHPGTVRRVFLQISKEPLFTIGKESFLNEVLELAGAASVTNTIEGGYPQLSKETALALNPEAIVLSDSPDNREPNDAFRNSPAVKNDHVYRINADLLSRPGPRLVDALEQIAKDLHPEKFR